MTEDEMFQAIIARLDGIKNRLKMIETEQKLAWTHDKDLDWFAAWLRASQSHGWQEVEDEMARQQVPHEHRYVADIARSVLGQIRGVPYHHDKGRDCERTDKALDNYRRRALIAETRLAEIAKVLKATGDIEDG